MSIGKRLRTALEECGMSVREFHRQMEGRSVRGSSYPTIHRYLADKSEPSMAFLKSAAELLEVRESWLAQGDGARTEAEEMMSGSIRPESPAHGVIRQTIDALPETKSLPDHLKGDFVIAWARRAGVTEIHKGKLEDLKTMTPDPEIARNLAREILSPFEAMEFEPDADSMEFRDYVSAMLVALNLATMVDEK